MDRPSRRRKKEEKKRERERERERDFSRTAEAKKDHQHKGSASALRAFHCRFSIVFWIITSHPNFRRTPRCDFLIQPFDGHQFDDLILPSTHHRSRGLPSVTYLCLHCITDGKSSVTHRGIQTEGLRDLEAT